MDKETQEFLERKFNRIDEKFDTIDGRFNRIDERLDASDARFNTIDERLEENKRYFGVVAEGLRNEVRQVAEGVANVDEKLEHFRGEFTEEFKEVRALIKFSYAELGQRIRVLEGNVQTLGARLDRLEAGRN